MNDDLLQAIRAGVRTRRHVIVVVAVLLVGGLVWAVCFDKTVAESDVVSAGNLGLFCGYTFALALFWFAGYRVAPLLPEGDPASLLIQDLVKPCLTLMTLALGHDVLPIALEPFLPSGGRTVYDDRASALEHQV